MAGASSGHRRWYGPKPPAAMVSGKPDVSCETEAKRRGGKVSYRMVHFLRGGQNLILFVERNISGYIDGLKFCSLFLLIAQFNSNKRPPHNTSTTHNNNQNEPPLPYPWRLCPLIPWPCQRCPQRMAPRLPMAPRKVPVIQFGRAMVGSLVGGAK
jgi:hypothetical protein